MTLKQMENKELLPEIKN